MSTATPDLLKSLGIEPEHLGAYDGRWIETSGELLESTNPATGKVIARIRQASAKDYERCSKSAHEAFLRWREVPAPKRGEIVRKMGERLREHKDALGRLVSL